MALKYICKGDGIRTYQDGLSIVIKSEKKEKFLTILMNQCDADFIPSFARMVTAALEEHYWDWASDESDSFGKHFRHYFFHKATKKESIILREYGIEPEKE